jgi:hypothetical protein
LRQANDTEFERYIPHAQMKLRAPMRDERAKRTEAPTPDPTSTPRSKGSGTDTTATCNTSTCAASATGSASAAKRKVEGRRLAERESVIGEVIGEPCW